MRNSNRLPLDAQNPYSWQISKGDQQHRSHSEIPQDKNLRVETEVPKLDSSSPIKDLNLEANERLPRRMKLDQQLVMKNCEQNRFLHNPAPINGISIDYFNHQVIFPVSTLCGQSNPINFTILNIQPPFQQFPPFNSGYSVPFFIGDQQSQRAFTYSGDIGDQSGVGSQTKTEAQAQNELSRFSRKLGPNPSNQDHSLSYDNTSFQNQQLSEHNAPFPRSCGVTVSKLPSLPLFVGFPQGDNSQIQQSHQAASYQNVSSCLRMQNQTQIDSGFKPPIDELRLTKSTSIEQPFDTVNEKARNDTEKEEHQMIGGQGEEPSLSFSNFWSKDTNMRAYEQKQAGQSVPEQSFKDFNAVKSLQNPFEDVYGMTTFRPLENTSHSRTSALKACISDPLIVDEKGRSPQRFETIGETVRHEISSPTGRLEVIPVQVSITKKNRLLCLFNLLKSLFLNELNVLTNVTEITDKEFLIFQRIILKKTGELLNSKEQLLDPAIASRILEKFNRNSVKRKEENCKFIYKSVLKRMMRAFELKNDIKQDENITFYNYYFSEIAKEMKQPVERYWDPTSMRIPNKPIFVTPFKSINHNFLLQVFAAKQFRKEFCTFLSSTDFLEMCREKVKKKLAKLMNKWDKELKNTNIECFQEKVENYFKEAKRCKLPWTIYEVEVARKYFLELPYFYQSITNEKLL